MFADLPTFGGELFQEWRYGEILPELGRVLLEFVHDGSQADRIGVVHRTAPIGGPAVAIDPHDVDVGCANGNAFFQNLRALVDHRIDATLQNFLPIDVSRTDPCLLHELPDHLLG